MVARRTFIALALAACLATGVGAEELPPKDQPPAANATAATNRPWNEFETSWISLRLGFAAMEDGVFYVQDSASRQQMGDLTNEALFRLDDLSLSGRIKFARPWTFQVAGNYRGLDPTSSRGWTWTYFYLGIPIGDLATVTLGKQKLGVGLEMMENGRDIPFMERSVMTTATTFVDSHIVGARLWGSAAGGRMSWSAGWFNNWLDDGLSFGQSGNIFSGRLTGIAAESGWGKRLLHIGVSGVYREAQNGSFKAKSVPEVYEAPDFIDTGTFPGNHSSSFAGELAAVRGPVTLSGELTSTSVSSPQTDNPHFLGGYVMASWCLTGESRPYDRAVGTFGAIQPANPFSFGHGGRGAWEVAARYSSMDLTSGTVQGGRFDRLSGALSWYPTKQWRLEFNCGYGTLDRYGLRGHTSFYQLRLQFQL